MRIIIDTEPQLECVVTEMKPTASVWIRKPDEAYTLEDLSPMEIYRLRQIMSEMYKELSKYPKTHRL